eukprot:CAMPEP_0113938082 /NCGR_PEP_ID=MMETSP1339-20121228/4494_1 /TAXON_ID=94617 /ORGANISM="Fibrocapsa japonica" /LENGTH=182 /DNA_ID=CAMNT_0000941019 /DNA_START=133 /DNA_END=681 /DNA_ORIENTATION=+ /assembly_acc=CAM_ASM_000762
MGLPPALCVAIVATSSVVGTVIVVSSAVFYRLMDLILFTLGPIIGFVAGIYMVADPLYVVSKVVGLELTPEFETDAAQILMKVVGSFIVLYSAGALAVGSLKCPVTKGMFNTVTTGLLAAQAYYAPSEEYTMYLTIASAMVGLVVVGNFIVSPVNKILTHGREPPCVVYDKNCKKVTACAAC